MSRKKTEANGHAEDTPVAQLPAPEPPADPPPPEPEDHRNTPVFCARYGTIKGLVWANHTEHGVRYATTFVRLYRIGPDQWGQSTSFGYRDLDLLKRVADSCFEYIAQQYASDDVPF